MPAPCQIACKQIDAPSIGRNGYVGFLNGKTEVLKKDSAPFSARRLPCDILVEHDVGVTLRDGVTIYVDVYRPPDSGPDSRVPAIVSWSPFGKKLNGIKFLEMMTPYDMGVKPTTLSGLEKFEGVDPADFVPRGYAVINADTRGVGDSGGMCVIMGTQEGEDGYDCVEAIAKMTWCSGSVGMAGNSHLAIAQWFIAQLKPPSLKAIAPWEGCGDLFREQFLRGGIWAGDFFDYISGVMIQGRNGMESFKEMNDRSQVANPYWEDKRPDMSKIDIPAYITASYASPLHTMGSIRGYLEINNPKKWIRFCPYQEWHDLWAVPKSTEELLCFFDKYLKGINNDWEETPRVRMTTLLYGSKDAIMDEVLEDYPPPQTRDTKVYLDKNRSLSLIVPPSTGYANYESERSMSLAAFRYTFNESTRLCGIPKAVLYMSCDEHDDMDVYVTIRKLDKDGNPMLALNVPWSSIPPNSIEEFPPEKATDLILYSGPVGMLRASHREIDTSRSMHPNYPFHPHKTIQKVSKGEIVKLEIGLFAMSVEYEAGESIQVEVSGQNPQLPSWKELKDKLGTFGNKGIHKVHLGSENPSHIILPFFTAA